jgi:hypothetical protein
MVFCFECKNISYLMSFFFVQMESLALNWNYYIKQRQNGNRKKILKNLVKKRMGKPISTRKHL